MKRNNQITQKAGQAHNHLTYINCQSIRAELKDRDGLVYVTYKVTGSPHLIVTEADYPEELEKIYDKSLAYCQNNNLTLHSY